MLKKLVAAPAFVTSAFATAALALAVPAAAASDGVIVVGYADLDLTRADHAALLTKRLEAAASNACSRPYIRDLKAMADFNACVAEAVSGAQQTIAASLPLGVELASR